jgi:hypothetical protein
VTTGYRYPAETGRGPDLLHMDRVPEGADAVGIARRLRRVQLGASRAPVGPQLGCARRRNSRPAKPFNTFKQAIDAALKVVHAKAEDA